MQKMRTKPCASSSFFDFVPDAVDIGAHPACTDPHIPEKPPAQGAAVQELLPPACAGDNGTDILRPHPLGANLGIPQQLQTAVGEHGHDPVEHILPPEPGEEDHIPLFDGTAGKVEEDRITGIQEGGHAGARNGDRDMGMPLLQQGADGVEIALGVEDFGHINHLRFKVDTF